MDSIIKELRKLAKNSNGKSVLLPKPFPHTEKEAKKQSEQKQRVKFERYDLDFVLQFIADMAEE